MAVPSSPRIAQHTYPNPSQASLSNDPLLPTSRRDNVNPIYNPRTPQQSQFRQFQPPQQQHGPFLAASRLPSRGPPKPMAKLSPHSSMAEKYSQVDMLDARTYSTDPEPDDFLHNPDPRNRDANTTGSIFTLRGLSNLGCLITLALVILGVFAGYPLGTFIYKLAHPRSYLDGFNIGGLNSSGQIPDIGNWGLIDVETPMDIRTKPSYIAGKGDLQLVFSDEFNTDGRSFYPGDDPFWTAEDLHYWQTDNLEWVDPGAVTTKDGYLEITLSKRPSNNLDYQGGMVSTWNKFCFTGGLIETSVILPGSSNVVGLWPAVWTMGNLGRAGYGASLEGMWPYSYDECDVGTAKNQTVDGKPEAATQGGETDKNGELSYQPGQRLSKCTCPDESHPGPKHSDGTFVGRSAPEIDVLEGTIDATALIGRVSQSSQWAPFNENYLWNFADTSTFTISDTNHSILNGYHGGAFQQVVSALTQTDQNCYEGGTGCASTYGFEYQPGFDGGYIQWISDGKTSWSHTAAAVGADSGTEISARAISQEPMYIIANLGMAESFGTPDLEHLQFPATMKIDWIRVYQDPDNLNVGCDPKNFPTSDYINKYMEAYTNPLLTTWKDDFKQPYPKSSLLGEC